MENYRLPVTIRYSDIDMNRHVNNAVYFTYMENARTELLKNELLEYHEKGIVFIVSEASCKYRRPILLSDSIICEIKFELLSPLRIGVTYFFSDSGTAMLHAEGKTTLVMVDETSGKAVKIPGELMDRLAKSD
ncbi:MAG: thioesterase family protein [Bacteroidales bacterium]|nr:thioesterase family protein [Bacteroidales bacterium]